MRLFLNSAFLLLLFLSRTVGAEKQDLPDPVEAYPMDRYQVILDKSPFAKETAIVEESKGASFGQDLVMTSLFQMDKTIYAITLNTKTQEHWTISSDESDDNRPKVVSLINDADPHRRKVVVQKGAETATLSFQASDQSPPQPATANGAAPPPAPNSSEASSTAKPLPRVRYTR